MRFLAFFSLLKFLKDIQMRLRHIILDIFWNKETSLKKQYLLETCFSAVLFAKENLPFEAFLSS